jgi:multidrug resistance efflux pump
MQAEQPSILSAPAHLAAQALARLARFEGTTEAFWQTYLHAIGQALSARRVLLLVSAVGRPWQAKSQWSSGLPERVDDASWTLDLIGRATPTGPLVQKNDRQELALAMIAGHSADGTGPVVAVVALEVDVVVWNPSSLQTWAALVGSIPSVWLASQSEPRPSSPSETLDDVDAKSSSHPEEVQGPVVERAKRLHDVLQVSLRLQQNHRFMALAMAVCNEVALHHRCERVSLGWVKGHDVRLLAVSHIENFDPRASATRALEAAMEEAMDQVCVLVCPAEPGSHLVLDAHEAYRQAVGVPGALTSLPLIDGEEIYAVLSLERQAGGLTPDEQWELQLLMQSVARWLRLLRQRDRWVGARLWDAMVKQTSQALQPRNTAAKLAVIGVVGALVMLSWIPMPYRVDATLSVRSQDLLFVPAPFDGFLRRVQVLVGDAVAADDVLVELDTRELNLEASAAESDFVRFSRESEKALAAGQLAEMQIASSRAQQAAARLQMVRFQLRNAQVRAPYAGVVIEGDLRKNLGAPVRKGDLLLKLAKSEGVFLELEIDQAYIHEVQEGSRGQFSLVGRPEERFNIAITRIEPAATHKDGRTFYLARAELDSGKVGTWRPGMGGNARIDIGERPLLWILTHRTVRFLREYFWL